MNNIEIMEHSNTEFYPTPENIVNKMIDKVKWNTVETVLEPSAGSGNILKGIASEYPRLDVDCIEIDSNLRQVLAYNFSADYKQELESNKLNAIKKENPFINSHRDYHKSNGKYFCYNAEKRQYIPFSDNIQKMCRATDRALKNFFNDGIHIIHDDFLTFNPYKKYSLIIMNPPFSNGEKHLLKALEIQKNGGQIVCLLNAETLKNPCTTARQKLSEILEEHNADVEFIQNGFSDSDHRTDVEVALVTVNIPQKETDNEPSLFEKIAKEKHYTEPQQEDITTLEVTDFLKSIVNRYQIEIESGIELIKIYNRMKPYLRGTFDEKELPYATPTLKLTNGADNSYYNEVTVNGFVKKVRRKYWEALLENKNFVGKLTSKLQQEYREKVAYYANYDFSEFNIKALLTEMNSHIKQGIEDECVAMFDRLTIEHSHYPECANNHYLYDGWKTNKAWKIEKKSILPCYGVFSQWDGLPHVYDAYKVLADIERILNFFDGEMTADVDLEKTLQEYFAKGITKNIPCKHFTVTFYKKGTVHIVYNRPDLIKRFNIYVGQNRKWLPPSYGQKPYEYMTAEEQATVDSFQGEKDYTETLKRASYFLAPITENTTVDLLIG